MTQTCNSQSCFAARYFPTVGAVYEAVNKFAGEQCRGRSMNARVIVEWRYINLLLSSMPAHAPSTQDSFKFKGETDTRTRQNRHSRCSRAWRGPREVEFQFLKYRCEDHCVPQTTQPNRTIIARVKRYTAACLT